MTIFGDRNLDSHYKFKNKVPLPLSVNSRSGLVMFTQPILLWIFCFPHTHFDLSHLTSIQRCVPSGDTIYIRFCRACVSSNLIILMHIRQMRLCFIKEPVALKYIYLLLSVFGISYCYTPTHAISAVLSMDIF